MEQIFFPQFECSVTFFSKMMKVEIFPPSNRKENTMKKIFNKFGKKKVYIAGAVASIVVVIALIILVMPHKTKIELSTDGLGMEYGENPYDLKIETVLKNYDKLVEEKAFDDFTISLMKEDKVIEKTTITEKEPVEVGEYKMSIKFNKDKKETELLLPIVIKDTINPVFEDFDTLEIEAESEKALAEYFTATDLSGEVKITVKDADKDNPFDVAKEGEYKVKVIAEDKHGNKTTKDCTVTVTPKPEVEETPNANNEGGNGGYVAQNNGGGGYNGGGSQAIAPSQPNGIGAVINTAYSFVGRTDMSCNDLVVQAYGLNGYDTPYNNALYMGYNVGSNSSVLQAGDMLIINDHVMLVVSVSPVNGGSHINTIEGGIDGTNVMQHNHTVTGNTIYYGGVGGGETILQIRRY